MSQIKDAKPIATKKPAIARSAMACMLLALVFGCGDAETSPVYIGPGTGGSTGSGGASGMGGISGSGGATGTGGTGSTGGTGGSGGVATKSICIADTPPSSNLCETDLNCALSGYVCVDSGCKDEGAPIKQCQPARGGSCTIVDECPNPTDYECTPVGGPTSPKRCVRVTPGCDLATETYDCPPGFSCEENACVDRRIPCDSTFDCPKSHVCTTTPVASYCTRTHRTCHEDTDCGGFAAAGSFCADVDNDNDGTKECVGDLGGDACINSDCVTASAPVCETGGDEIVAACGDYGLCRTNNDCDLVGGFECVGLWQDGRKECVRTGGTCNQVMDCDPPQVCAAPRNGGPPSCQAGNVP